MAELGAEQCRLQRIEAEVATNRFVIIFRCPSVNTQDSHTLSEGIVVGGYHATVAEAAEVLGRKKTERTEVAHRAGFFFTELRAHRLGGVLEHHQVVRTGQALHGVHVGRLPEQVHRDDRLGFVGNTPRGVLEVEVEIVVQRIDEHRGRAGS